VSVPLEESESFVKRATLAFRIRVKMKDRVQHSAMVDITAHAYALLLDQSVQFQILASPVRASTMAHASIPIPLINAVVREDFSESDANISPNVFRIPVSMLALVVT